MAESKKTAEAAVVDGEELVEFAIPMSGPNEQPVFLGVNGENVRVKPGEPVKIKRKFVEVWNNAKRQERDAWNAQEEAVRQSRKSLADL